MARLLCIDLGSVEMQQEKSPRFKKKSPKQGQNMKTATQAWNYASLCSETQTPKLNNNKGL